MCLEQKKKKTRWLPAFTLMETLVTMALMGILCNAGYYAMSLVNRHYQLFQQNIEALYTYQHLAQCLQNDVEKASLVKINDKVLACQNDQQIVYYTFDEKIVCRSSSLFPEVRDTFVLITQNLSTSLGKNPVTDGVIDELIISLVQFDKRERLYLFKSYSSEQLMQIQQQ